MFPQNAPTKIKMNHGAFSCWNTGLLIRKLRTPPPPCLHVRGQPYRNGIPLTAGCLGGSEFHHQAGPSGDITDVQQNSHHHPSKTVSINRFCWARWYMAISPVHWEVEAGGL